MLSLPWSHDPKKCFVDEYICPHRSGERMVSFKNHASSSVQRHLKLLDFIDTYDGLMCSWALMLVTVYVYPPHTRPSLLTKTYMKRFIILVLLFFLRIKKYKPLFFFCHLYVKPVVYASNIFYVFSYPTCKPMLFSFH